MSFYEQLQAATAGSRTQLISTPIVVEQEATAFAAPAAPTTLWYYCTEPPGYFPYVQTCNRAWIPVVPQASPAG